MSCSSLKSSQRDPNWCSLDTAKHYSKNIFTFSANLVKIAVPVVMGLGAVYWAIQPGSEESALYDHTNHTMDAPVAASSSTAVALLQDAALLAAGGVQGGFALLGMWGVGAHINRTLQRDLDSQLTSRKWISSDISSASPLMVGAEELNAPASELKEIEDQDVFELNVLKLLYNENDKEAIEYVLNNGNFKVSRYLINRLCVERRSFEIVRLFIQKYEGDVDSEIIIDLINAHGFDSLDPVMDKLLQQYKPGYNYQAYDFELLAILRQHNRDEFVRQIWLKHETYFTNPHTLNFYSRHTDRLDLLKWIFQMRGSSISVPKELLENIVRNGDTEFAKLIAKNLPLEQVPGHWFFKRDWQDCIADDSSLDLSRFPFNTTAVGRFNCRTLFLTDEGRVYSFSGLDTRKVALQMAKGQSTDSFTIYLNNGHASIAFSDGHFGFYPSSSDEPMAKLENPIVLSHCGVKTAASTGMEVGFGKASINNKKRSKKGALAPINYLFFTQNYAAHDHAHCKIVDDSKEKSRSEAAGGLTLTVFLPKEKIEAARRYVDLTRDSCDQKKEAFQLLDRNCIHFVQRVFETTGSKTDFRDAFYTTDYLRRIGAATIFSMLNSNPPIELSPRSFESMSFPEMIDQVPRITYSALSAILITYQMYKKIRNDLPEAYRATARALSRIQRVAIVALECATTLYRIGTYSGDSLSALMIPEG